MPQSSFDQPLDRKIALDLGAIFILKSKASREMQTESCIRAHRGG
jgi:hypothetical protein